MSAHRGGRKRSYKRKGRMSCKKAYQAYCKAQREAGLTNTAYGTWVTADIGSLRSRGLYGHG